METMQKRTGKFEDDAMFWDAVAKDRQNLATFRRMLAKRTQEKYGGNPYVDDPFREGRHEGYTEAAEEILEEFNRLFPEE